MSTEELVRSILIGAGVAPLRAEEAADALIAAGLVVVSDFYVPSMDELIGLYRRLGDAHLHGQITVRWVMCRETHDALYARYNATQYPPTERIPFSQAIVEPSAEVLQHEIRTIMERNRRWGDPSSLFGIPIRIDPAARRPMFEIEES